MQPLKLTMELVPATSWWNNLRRKSSKAAWENIRKTTFAQYGQRCGVCSADGKLNCHEVWEYDDEEHVQRLASFIALCGLCHHIKHIGLAGILAGKGRLDYERLVNHFLEVNGCDRAAFEEHKRESFKHWRERSRWDWRLELGEYESQIVGNEPASSIAG